MKIAVSSERFPTARGVVRRRVDVRREVPEGMA